MANPRDRQASTSQPSDRRMRGRRPQRADRRMQLPSDQRTRRRRRGLVIGGVVLLIIAGIAIYGYYDQFIAPSRVLAARVGDTVYTQGDLVNRMRMLQAASAARGEPLDLGTVPFEVLNNIADAEIIRRAAPGFNIQVTEADIEFGLRQRFFPRIPEGQEVQPEQIEREYREIYQRFLNSSHLSDKDYRNIVEESIHRTRLREKLGEQVPLIDEQVEVHWVRLSLLGNLAGGRVSQTPEQVLELLGKEGFEDIAKTVSTDRRYADEKGYVGWVPKGAFPSLDAALFGSVESEPLAHNEIGQPISTPDGTYILKVTAGPEEREISEIMREKLKDEALESWVLEQRRIGKSEGWFEEKFNSEIYRWVVEQIGQSAPRVTPPTGGQG